MKYNQIIGYADAAGLSKPVVLLGPGDPDEKKFAMLDDAADRHIFPSGIKRLAHVAWDRSIRELEFISEDVASTAQNNDKLVKKLDAERKAKAQAERDAQKNFTAANVIFQKASQKRNAALGLVSAAEGILNATKFPAEQAEKEAKFKADQMVKIDKAKKDYQAALDEFNAVLAQFNIIRNPKSTPEQKQAAYVALGIIKPISQPEAPAAS
jgi:hypothetical protein